MIKSQIYNLGILAFGSLIDNPGEEISEIEIDRIKCETPFNVEFARVSSTRSKAPTLIPFLEGQQVKAVIIVLREGTDIEKAKSILWRRELHKNNRTKTYTHSKKPSENKVIVETLSNFMNVKTVLYASISSNIHEPLTSELLANFAIASILSEAGQQKKDGIRYLLSAKKNGILTSLSDDYERTILIKTDVRSLEEAIEKLDIQRGN